MRIAAIDIGTNTFHLIIADSKAEGLEICYKTHAAVRLGEGRLNENLIIPAAYKRGLDQLKQYAQDIKQYGVEKLKVTATSAVRNALNGQAFVEEVRSNTGLTIEIIDGDAEAQYIYAGVKASGAITGISLIMDIGGGSTEFICCDTHGLLWKKSLELGAARLMQGFFHSDPLNDTDRAKLSAHISQMLEPVIDLLHIYQPKTLIGSAGAFESFAQILNPALVLKNIKTLDLPLEDYKNRALWLLESNHAAREALPGLIPLRVDMIVMAAMLCNYLLAHSSIEAIKLSTYDLKMGLLAEMHEQHLNKD